MGQNALSSHTLVKSLCRYEVAALGFMQAEEAKTDVNKPEGNSKSN
jgi:hypothetical protein